MRRRPALSPGRDCALSPTARLRPRAGRMLRRCMTAHCTSRQRQRFRHGSRLSSSVLVAGTLAACARTAAQPATPPPPKVTVAEVVSPRDHRVGRVHRPARGRQHRRGPAARLRLRLRRPLRRGRDRPRGDLLFQIDAAAVPGRGRSAARRARARARHRPARQLRAAARRAAGRRERHVREEHDRRAAFAQESAAQVAAVEAALRAAELNLEFTRVTAPIAGRVGRAIVTEGNLVSSGPRRGDAADDRGVARSDLRVVRRRRADLPQVRRSRTPGQARERAAAGLPIRMALAERRDVRARGDD